MARKTAITNIAQALSCVRKMKSGKACTMAEMKATAMLLETAYRTVTSQRKAVQKNLEFMERQFERIGSFRS